MNKNYTNYEQTHKLLQLGVAVDSADCVMFRKWDWDNKDEWCINLLGTKKYSEVTKLDGYTTIPCWSLGQLIDIYEVCTGWSFEDNMTERGSMSLVDYVIQEIEETILHDDRKMIRFDMDKYC